MTAEEMIEKELPVGYWLSKDLYGTDLFHDHELNPIARFSGGIEPGDIEKAIYNYCLKNVIKS